MRDPEGVEPGRFRLPRLIAGGLVLALVVAVGFAVARRDGARTPITSEDSSPTDGSETLVDPDDFISGGPPPDGIPPIDEPKFEAISGIDWLEPQEPVIALEIDGDARAYPLQIMTWHEIVNDDVGGVPVSVTFCPLCNTAYVFERPEIDGAVTTFGTSGQLYNSNLVMYDRATESLWPQALGIAATGPLTGMELERVPAQIVSWDDFRSAFPRGTVLSQDTGHARSYGTNPYPGYDDVDRPPFLFTGEVDGRLAAVERILGVEESGEVMAFPYFRLEELAEGDATAVNAEVGGAPITVLWKKGAVSALDQAHIAASRDVGAAAAFSPRVGDRTLTLEVHDGAFIDKETETEWDLFGRAVAGPLEGERLGPVDAHDSFWFDWAAFHPQTEVWSGD